MSLTVVFDQDISLRRWSCRPMRCNPAFPSISITVKPAIPTPSIFISNRGKVRPCTVHNRLLPPDDRCYYCKMTPKVTVPNARGLMALLASIGSPACLQ